MDARVKPAHDAVFVDTQRTGGQASLVQHHIEDRGPALPDARVSLSQRTTELRRLVDADAGAAGPAGELGVVWIGNVHAVVQLLSRGDAVRIPVYVRAPHHLVFVVVEDDDQDR